MKYLLHRSLALLLAVLVQVSYSGMPGWTSGRARAIGQPVRAAFAAVA